MNEQEVRALFLLAQIEIVGLHQLLNAYWGDNSTRGPWWLVETRFGLIRIGWRKRVVEIEWSSTPLRDATLTKDDVTKTDTLLHAWSYHKTLEYLDYLRLGLQRVCGRPAATA